MKGIDLSIVVVKDQVSLVEARRVFDLLAQRGTPAQQARVLLSLVDLRIKYREGENIDILAHLVSEIRREGYPLFETFVSRSPKIEALYTNPNGQAHSILQGAPESVVHGQMRELAEEVLRVLEGSARKAVSVRPSPAPSELPVSATGNPAPRGFARARPRPDGSSSVRTLLRGT